MEDRRTDRAARAGREKGHRMNNAEAVRVALPPVESFAGIEHGDHVPNRIIALDEESRSLSHVISTARLDRANRIVDVSGWRLGNFRAHPVVMLDHDYAFERIAGTGEPSVRGDALV